MHQSIRQKDLMIIVEAACQMAQADSKLDETEIELLKKIMHAGGIDTNELKKFENSNKSNIKDLANQLSSVKAKRLFLLTLVGTSLADQSVDITEKKMIDDLTKELEVGSISASKMSYKSCEEMILKMISESKVIIDFTGE